MAVEAAVAAHTAVGIAATAVARIVVAHTAVGIAATAVARIVVAAAGCPPYIADKSPARLASAPRSFGKSPCSFLRCIVRSFFAS